MLGVFLAIAVVFLLLAISIVVMQREDKHHEDVCEFRIVEKNYHYYIQQHFMIVGDDGISHSVWEYVCESMPLRSHKILEFDYYYDALSKVKELRIENAKYRKESFKEYLDKKRDDYTIIKYFE